jgi:ankyrin repeat protein
MDEGRRLFTVIPSLLLGEIDGDSALSRWSIAIGRDVNAGVYMTPLLFVCATGNYERAKALLDAGANVQMVNVSLLAEAICSPTDEENKCKFVELLLSRGADVNYPSTTCTPTGHIRSPLDAAIAAGCVNVAKLLVQNGARIIDPESNRPTFEDMLDLPAEFGNLPLFEFLLDNGPKVTGSHDDWIGEALFPAIYCDGTVDVKKRMLELALAKGMDVNVRNFEDLTLLHTACGCISAQDNEDEFLEDCVRALIVGLLLESGAEVNAVLEDGRSPLLVLCGLNMANVDDVDAALGVVSDCVKMLLDHGADVDLCDNDGRSPLEVAVQTGKNDVVDALLAHKMSEQPEYF